MAEHDAFGFFRRAGANLGRVFRKAAARATLPRRGRAWLAVRLSGAVQELAPPRLWGRSPPLGLFELLRTLESAADDPNIAGVVLRFEQPLEGWSRVLSLRRAVDHLRQRGKHVIAYGEVLGAESLVVASGADKLWMPQTGSVLLVGLRIEGFFIKRLLDRFDIRPEILRVGSHKTAGDRFVRESMSPEEREQLGGLADDLFEALIDSIATGRGLEPDAVRDAIDRGPFSAAAAESEGLSDGCLYPDEVERELVRLAPDTTSAGDDEVPQLLDARLYHALVVADPGWRPLWVDLPRIAYVVGMGTIHRGRGARGIASETFREIFERIRRDDGIQGVVLRLDSPGGDGVASDLLWRSISRVSEKKPVVVSMGDVAASGGYYMAAAADVVLAEASTITGSIGVVGGKIDLQGAYERLGVVKDGVERGAHAGLFSEARGYTGDERAAVQALLDAVYDSFVDRVAEGRNLSREAVARVAQGKIWSGVRAQTHGLVDGLGGPLDALAEVRRRAGLSDTDRFLLESYPRLPAIPSLFSLLRLLPGRMELW